MQRIAYDEPEYENWEIIILKIRHGLAPASNKTSKRKEKFEFEFAAGILIWHLV